MLETWYCDKGSSLKRCKGGPEIMHRLEAGAGMSNTCTYVDNYQYHSRYCGGMLSDNVAIVTIIVLRYT